MSASKKLRAGQAVILRGYVGTIAQASEPHTYADGEAQWLRVSLPHGIVVTYSDDPELVVIE